MFKLSRLMFHLLQFLLFCFPFSGTSFNSTRRSKRYQEFPLKFLETKISQFLFSVTKLIGHREQNFNLHSKKSKYKTSEMLFSREDFK